MSEIKVEHPNGYTGVLYGNRSMIIFYNDKEVLHTGFRNINTKEELYNQLEDMQRLMKILDEAEEE